MNSLHFSRSAGRRVSSFHASCAPRCALLIQIEALFFFILGSVFILAVALLAIVVCVVRLLCISRWRRTDGTSESPWLSVRPRPCVCVVARGNPTGTLAWPRQSLPVPNGYLKIGERKSGINRRKTSLSGDNESDKD